ncbi:MAG: trypsin-like peptidase domain-containing protein [Desulfuromonadales bacterium]|nr:trypsin-like peptidase domain-containing protein [Desulfuromonadales bacterium]
MIRLFFCLLLAIAMPCLAYAKDERNAVVGIYSTKTDGTVAQGTGFFLGDNGEIVTNYHVIKNSIKMEIYYVGGKTSNVLVERVIPNYDLAVLKINKLPIGNLSLKKRKLPENLHKKELIVIGHPRGLEKYYFSARATSQTISSLNFKDLNGHRIFKKAIDVIPVDLTIYSGMSGAPVIYEGDVIGVLSGSINEGGSISWAIPIENITKGILYKKNMTWPDFDLMNSNWRSSTNKYEQRETIPEIIVFIDKYSDNKEFIASQYTELSKLCLSYENVINELNSITYDFINKMSIVNITELDKFSIIVSKLQKQAVSIELILNNITSREQDLLLSLDIARKIIGDHHSTLDDDLFLLAKRYIEYNDKFSKSIQSKILAKNDMRNLDEEFAELMIQAIKDNSYEKQKKAFELLKQSNKLRSEEILGLKNLKYDSYLLFEYFDKLAEASKYIRN